MQVGGTTSSGCAPVGLTAHPSPQSDDVVMGSADIEIPSSSPANASIPPPISVIAKRCRDDEDLEEEQVAKVPAITSVGLKRGRSDSSSSLSSSKQSRRSKSTRSCT